MRRAMIVASLHQVDNLVILLRRVAPTSYNKVAGRIKPAIGNVHEDSITIDERLSAQRLEQPEDIPDQRPRHTATGRDYSLWVLFLQRMHHHHLLAQDSV